MSPQRNRPWPWPWLALISSCRPGGGGAAAFVWTAKAQAGAVASPADLRLDSKTIVVGNGPSVRPPLGHYIDVFKNVVRVNNFKAGEGIRDASGVRATHLFLHKATLPGNFSRFPRERLLLAPFGDSLEIIQERMLRPSGSGLRLSNVTVLPEFYFEGLNAAMNASKRDMKKNALTGTVALAWCLRNIPERPIYVVGFDLLTAPDRGYAHYAGAAPLDDASLERYHHVELDRRYLEGLVRRGEVRVLDQEPWLQQGNEPITDGEPMQGDVSIMRQRAHGTCAEGPPEAMRWDASRDTADSICCHNRRFAEFSGYWERTSFPSSLKDVSGEITFYDTVTAKPLFVAPRGRTLEAFVRESRLHGWPSFRDGEVVRENVRVLPDGETVSVDGTHLGHNLPDGSGNRYCIDLVCIAHMPPETAASGV